MHDHRSTAPHAGTRWAIVLALASAATACDHAPQPPPLHPAIARVHAEAIRLGHLAPPRHCGRLVEVKMDPEKVADAEPVYYDNTTGAVVVHCDNPLARRDIPPERWTVCPPPEWRCGP